jgi:hypothetical protein
VQVGQSQPFTATVLNDAQNKGVTWSLSGAGCTGVACGVLSAASSASGLAITYTAPAGMDGSEKMNGPVDITSSLVVSGTGDGASGGSVAFNTPHAESTPRPGARQWRGIRHLGLAWDRDPCHGWVVGYSAANLAHTPIGFNDSPNGSRSGIRMSGGAPAADSSNNLYLITGNGTYDGTAKSDYGDTFLKLSTSGGVSVADWFTPADESSLEGGDTDFGSGGAAILVDQPSGPVPHLVIGGGKEGNWSC